MPASLEAPGSMRHYHRDILALDDDELELFVFDWMRQKEKGYVKVERFSGSSDMGRDVVGFLSDGLHEGPWHNYQCKQLGRTLQPGNVILELGKILYFSFTGAFTTPSAYTFIAPKGTSRKAEQLIFNPSQLKEALLTGWEDQCARKIIKNVVIPLDAPLRTHIEAFDFAAVSRQGINNILADSFINPVLVQWFGADPGPPPKGTVPPEVLATETEYVGQLLTSYGERDGCEYSCCADVADHPEHVEHLSYQRERFFQADSFNRHFRDNTMPVELADLHNDIYHDTVQTHRAKHEDSLARVDAVMDRAAAATPGGPLAKYARVPIKQGICHHFVNDGRWKWQK
ncbi:MAG: hypothetical protein Q7R40_02890 [Phaeospirillum sp.]|nr:hypothetical protein [Phaeospirillum sp.]